MFQRNVRKSDMISVRQGARPPWWIRWGPEFPSSWKQWWWSISHDFRIRVKLFRAVVRAGWSRTRSSDQSERYTKETSTCDKIETILPKSRRSCKEYRKIFRWVEESDIVQSVWCHRSLGRRLLAVCQKSQEEIPPLQRAKEKVVGSGERNLKVKDVEIHRTTRLWRSTTMVWKTKRHIWSFFLDTRFSIVVLSGVCYPDECRLEIPSRGTDAKLHVTSSNHILVNLTDFEYMNESDYDVWTSKRDRDR